MKKVLLFYVSLVLFSCQHQENFMEDLVECTSPAAFSDSSFVDINLAKRVASLDGRHQSRSINPDYQEITTLTDKNNIPWCYVVNYNDNNGYVMVSATKNYHPILMWSDNGSFNVNNIPDAAQFYLDGFRTNIEFLRNAPFDSIYRYRQEWMEYEESPTPKRVKSRSLPSDVIYCMQQHEALWWSEGHQYSPIATNGLNLPTSVYENAVFMAELSMREDFMETSYIVRKEEVETIYVPNMLTTTWGQTYPYNAKVQEYTGLDNVPVGCFPLAIAQVMKYHQYPNTYNWSEMPNSISYANYGGVPQLLLEVGIATNTVYRESISLTQINPALEYLHSIGYEDATDVAHNQFTVRTQMLLNKPVIMTGKTSNSSIGHTWVCDGLNEYNCKTAYYLMTIIDTEPLSYYAREIMVENESSSRTFHYVWGEFGSTDGWFRDNETVNLGTNYNVNRRDIININR